jgi:hypothetical protein
MAQWITEEGLFLPGETFFFFFKKRAGVRAGMRGRGRGRGGMEGAKEGSTLVGHNPLQLLWHFRIAPLQHLSSLFFFSKIKSLKIIS